MWVLLLFKWKIMEYTYSAQPKTLLHIVPVPQAAPDNTASAPLQRPHPRAMPQPSQTYRRGFRRDGEEVMKEVKYLLDVLILNFCDSRVRDVRIEIERDAIAVDKICIHLCIVPVIIFLREISGKRNGCPRFFDINRCNLISHICNFPICIIKFHNLRNEILKKFPVNIKMKIISQCARIWQK